MIVTDDLARRLDVEAGDAVRIGSAPAIRVAGVVPGRGVAGFSLRAGADAMNVVMSRTTFRSIVDADAGVANPSARSKSR